MTTGSLLSAATGRWEERVPCPLTQFKKAARRTPSILQYLQVKWQHPLLPLSQNVAFFPFSGNQSLFINQSLLPGESKVDSVDEQKETEFLRRRDGRDGSRHLQGRQMQIWGLLFQN